MKRLKVIICIVLYLCILPVSLYSFDGAWNSLQRFLKSAHTWTGTQTFSTVNIQSGTILAGVSKFFVQTGTTVTASMLGNGLIYWDSTTMGGVTVPTISDNAQIVTLKDIQAAGVTIFTENSQAVLNQNAWGTKIWVAPGNLGNQVTISSVMTGTSTFWDVVGSIGSWRVE